MEGESMGLVKKSELLQRRAALVSKRPGTRVRLMSIDPSINNVGMAIWDLDIKKVLIHKLLHPLPTCRDNEYAKSLSIFSQVKEWMKTYNVRRLILEVPEHWAVSGFQARESGSMVKLAIVCGMLYSMHDDLDELKVVTPRQWKGQLSKNVVENRLREHYLPFDIDLTKLNDNVMDAISIGHFYVYGSV